MKLAILVILLTAMFLGGYYVGRLPGAPDVFGMAQNAYAQSEQAREFIDTLVRSQPTASATPLQAQPVVVEVGGKQYRIGEQSRAEFACRK